MDFDLSKPQKLLQESARTFFGRECSPERLRSLMATETGYDEELWSALADQGWTGLTLPEDCGGLDSASWSYPRSRKRWGGSAFRGRFCRPFGPLP